jgi:M6 family metalloprotease-like protein
MKILKFLFFIIFLSLTVSLYSMPPHPDAVAEYQKKGQLKSLMNRVESLNKMTGMDLPLKSFPASGTMRVPVLLVNYAVPYQASSELIFYKRIFNRDNMPLPGLLVLLTAALFLFFKNYSRLSTKYLRPVIPAYLSIFIFTLSCGIPPDDDEGGGFPTDTSVYSRILNGSTLSVRKYYQDMSRNNLNLTFDIYGPVTVSKSWDYYGENDSSGNDLRPRELVSEALRLLVSKYASVDFKIYDNDNDTFIDAVIIIHQGPGEEVKTSIEPLIWSHQWDLSSPVSTGDGVSFKVYTIQPEYTSNPGDSSMGVFAHEFSHVLGLPDLYDTSGQTNGVGDWSLMASGAWKGTGAANDGTAPAPLLAWERLKIGGTGAGKWITVTELASAGTQQIADVETSGEVFKLVLEASAGKRQYLLVEGKAASASFQWYVPGSGILVSHIHEDVISSYIYSNTVNDGNLRIHGVNIIEADGADLWSKANSGNAADLFTSGSLPPINKYDAGSPYALTPVIATTVSITNIQTGTTPLTFDYTP